MIAFVFAAIAIKIIVKKDGKFAGTCASQNPFLNKEEEIQELKDEEISKSERIEDEFGDLLFALINYSRFININPEDALEKTNKRFIKRFQILESMVKNQEKEFSDLSFEEMNLFWEKAKKISE